MNAYNFDNQRSAENYTKLNLEVVLFYIAWLLPASFFRGRLVWLQFQVIFKTFYVFWCVEYWCEVAVTVH